MAKFHHFLVLSCFFGSVHLVAQNTIPKVTEVRTTAQTVLLPEILLSFDAVLNDKKVEMTWSSNMEQNNNFFTIEKSKDAMAFEKLTTIRNFGNYSNIVSYFDVDYAPYEGISYYRLTQNNGNKEVLSSRIVSVNYRSEAKNLTFYPNTTATDEFVDLMGTENKEALVVLRNEKGEESYSKVFIDEDNLIQVSSENNTELDNGTYVIVASSNNKLYSKIVKVK